MLNIALNTFRELSRNKMLYLIIFFGVAFIAFSLVLASLSMGQTEKIVVDFGLAMVEIFGIISVIFIGSQLLFREIEGRTIYLILTKPISRYEFIIGKFLGFSAILFFVVFFQSLLFFLVLFFSAIPFAWLMVGSLLFIFLKLLILFAVILFFSSFISPMLSILLTVAIYFIGHGVSSVIDMALKSKEVILLWIGKVLYILLPNFEALNLKNFINTPVAPWMEYIGANLAYALAYLSVLLLLTVFIFSKKTFENS